MLDRLQTARNIHVVGISGTEGAAVALFLRQLKKKFTTHDFSVAAKFERHFSANHFALSKAKREQMLRQLLALPGGINYQDSYLKSIEKADLIFVSQNWEAYSPNLPLQKIFKQNPERFVTLTQLYFQLFPGKIMAITGTNGKSTTSKLIAEIMSQSRLRSYFTGNDRRNVQILDKHKKWHRDDWLIIEVSNRQLKFPLPRAPDVAVITNVTKNHLDEYGGSFENYIAGKFSLIQKQAPKQIAVLNLDNPVTARFLEQTKSTPLPYSLNTKVVHGVYIADNWIIYQNQKATKVLSLDKIKVPGRHNLSNILAAIAATRAAGVDWSTIRGVIGDFRGLAQRLELVVKKRGVSYINDTASTTPESTIAALQSFTPGTVRLIAGGESKGMDYGELAKAIKNSQTKAVLLKSPVTDALAKLLKQQGSHFAETTTLQEAVRLANENTKTGDSVVLSPSGAWFCYFADKIPLGGRGFEQFVKTLT